MNFPLYYIQYIKYNNRNRNTTSISMNDFFCSGLEGLIYTQTTKKKTTIYRISFLWMRNDHHHQFCYYREKKNLVKSPELYICKQ